MALKFEASTNTICNVLTLHRFIIQLLRLLRRQGRNHAGTFANYPSQYRRILYKMDDTLRRLPIFMVWQHRGETSSGYDELAYNVGSSGTWMQLCEIIVDVRHCTLNAP